MARDVDVEEDSGPDAHAHEGSKEFHHFELGIGRGAWVEDKHVHVDACLVLLVLGWKQEWEHVRLQFGGDLRETLSEQASLVQSVFADELDEPSFFV